MALRILPLNKRFDAIYSKRSLDISTGFEHICIIR
jgi:hypothetical protein